MSPARNVALSFTLALTLLAGLLPSACGGGSSATETASEPAEPEQEEEPVSEEGKRWSGWRWKGKRQECFFRVRTRCFDKLEAACAAARCAESQCKHDDGVPAVVSCRR